MKIINAMFSRVDGGVEQVFLHYNTVLNKQGHEVIPVIHPWAQIRKKCTQEHLKTIYNYGRNDLIAVYRLRKLIEKEKPSCIISHTKRAALLFEKTQTQVPKIAVCHTIESFKELEKASDAVIAITQQMHQEMMSQRATTKKIITVPNMIHIPDELVYKEPKENKIPVIGACARFSDLKGLDVFIKALAELKRKGFVFKAKIAGDGKQKKQYLNLIHQNALHNDVTLLGWIDDKKSFYDSLDIFCHPSLKESFGLVVVESMMYSVPMVLTQISGPLEIVGETECAVMVPPADPLCLAAGLEKVMGDLQLARRMAYNGFQRVKNYSSQAVGPVLHKVLNDICG